MQNWNSKRTCRLLIMTRLRSECMPLLFIRIFFFFYMSLYSYNNLLLDKKSNYANTKTVICKELIKPFDEKVYDHEHTKYQNIYVYIGYTGRHLVCVHLRRIHFQFHRDLFSIEINSITDLLISVEAS